MGTKKVLIKSKKESKKYKIKFLDHEFVVYPNVFSPKYFLDTQFFIEKIPIKKGEKFLEIGPGTGITVVFAILRGAKHVTAIDINRDAVKNTKENVKINGFSNKVTILEGDVYGPLKRGEKFDTIYWNTPFGYVDKNKNLTTIEKAVYDPGYKSTRKFIKGAKDHLKENGRILIGFSTTLGKFDIVKDLLKEEGFKVKLIAKKKSVETYPVYFEIFEATKK